ncbi:GNAT family N-acetyltransferase [Paenibacillus sp. IB182496]|uniref:GNAT family N-acetyltransferase n=1 Tax=Paenibacillus sabuli TaxID=2772509 RepID=A0A927GUN5_9BACL|nr:GNAT family N-acetyltransferase [Paenibacillus sabuli]MBD2847892.1 GNAT family N-acetyltransferase [Paenibacillus sabuli]
MKKTAYRIKRLTEEAEAARVVDFFLSDASFDDTRHTPGELVHFRTNPFKALQGEYCFWIAQNEQGDIVGVNSLLPNEQQTGGYYWDYVVVHRACRQSGIAAGLIDEMLAFLQKARARYVITYTCDLEAYDPIRKLFERRGFVQIGRCPDYYFDGEDRLIYYLKLTESGV